MDGRVPLHIRMLGSISATLAEVLREHRDLLELALPFKETYAFLRRLKPWHPGFAKPPMTSLRACDLEALTAFYRGRFDFHLFDMLPEQAQATIQHEVAAHAARTAMDTFMGGRLRNLAQIGIRRREWPRYQELVRAYYDRSLPEIRRERVERVVQRLRADQVDPRLIQRLRGELFYDVDRLRLMNHRQFEIHLEGFLHSQTAFQWRPAQRQPPPEVLQCLEWLQLPLRVGPETLKQRYRELARVYHPDKGGSVEQMRMLNAAYAIVRDYLQG